MSQQAEVLRPVASVRQLSRIDDAEKAASCQQHKRRAPVEQYATASKPHETPPRLSWKYAALRARQRPRPEPEGFESPAVSAPAFGGATPSVQARTPAATRCNCDKCAEAERSAMLAPHTPQTPRRTLCRATKCCPAASASCGPLTVRVIKT